LPSFFPKFAQIIDNWYLPLYHIPQLDAPGQSIA